MSIGVKTPIDPGPMTRSLREFWAGMTDLSGLSLAVCTALLAAICAFTMWFFQPQTMAGPLGDFIPRSSTDADAFALVEALRMANAPQMRPTIVFLGSSTVAQMVGNGHELEKRLADLATGPWQVRVLTTPLQSPLDQLRLLETVLSGRDADSAPLVVAVGMGLTRLGWTGARLGDQTLSSRIPLRSSWADAELGALGASVRPRRPLWGLENGDFVIRNGMKSLTRLALMRPAKRVVDSYASGRQPLERQAIGLKSVIEAGFSQRQEFFDMQARLAARVLAAPNTTLVFVEEPLAPNFVETYGLGALFQTFKDDVALMAEASSAAYWPVISDTALTQSHYFDYLHLLPGEAQSLCQTGIATKMAGITLADGAVR